MPLNSPGALALQFKRLHPEALAPVRGEPGAAGFDLSALCVTEGDRYVNRIIAPRSVSRIRTGLALLPPPGHYIQIASRSGLAAVERSPVFVANAPGIIDPNYTGEIIILLFNGGTETVYISHGHRIAQALVVPLPLVELIEIDRLPETSRGARGFGSTGE